MDILTYTYQDGNNNSNRLMKVTDAASVGASQEFNNGNSGTSNDYTYDDNGNMISDLNKNITSITYNYLNLPEEITFGNGSSIEYIYNAAGVKVMKTVNNVNPPNVYTDYLDGFQYVGGMLNFFPTAEGYVRATSITSDPADPQLVFNYVYNYTDHLGNIRLSYTKDPVSNELDILEENNYYPFGLKHKIYGGIKKDYLKEEPENGGGGAIRPGVVIDGPYNYKYQGQELQDELGLNWYSFKWRNYDPAIGRFFNADPLSEKYAYQSHYNFSENRVIDARELEGLESVRVQELKSTGAASKHFFPTNFSSSVSSRQVLKVSSSPYGDLKTGYLMLTTGTDFTRNDRIVDVNRTMDTTYKDSNGDFVNEVEDASSVTIKDTTVQTDVMLNPDAFTVSTEGITAVETTTTVTTQMNVENGVMINSKDSPAIIKTEVTSKAVDFDSLPADVQVNAANAQAENVLKNNEILNDANNAIENYYDK